MIPKRTKREFDSLLNEYENWPIELAYELYSMIIDDINEQLEKRDEKIISSISASFGDSA